MTVAAQPRLCRCTFSVPTIPDSVPAARRRAREDFCAWGLDPRHPVVDAALLALSELLTNSVKHAAGSSPEAQVTLAFTLGDLLVAVHDRDPRVPCVPEAPHCDGSGGWGLRMVAGLAAEAHGSTGTRTDADGGGKTMSVTLPVLPAGA
jgi:anti-sigma regulatory factor (Ser/Thr protein kinase)